MEKIFNLMAHDVKFEEVLKAGELDGICKFKL
jgi:hypothetical protein